MKNSLFLIIIPLITLIIGIVVGGYFEIFSLEEPAQKKETSRDSLEKGLENKTVKGIFVTLSGTLEEIKENSLVLSSEGDTQTVAFKKIVDVFLLTAKDSFGVKKDARINDLAAGDKLEVKLAWEGEQFIVKTIYATKEQ